MDLVCGCGTIRIVRSWWLAILTFVVVVIASPAEAQVFKPRGAKPAKTVQKAAPEKEKIAKADKAEKAENPADAADKPKKTAARTSPKKSAKKSRATEARETP